MEWVENPTLYPCPEEFSDENSVYVLDSRQDKHLFDQNPVRLQLTRHYILQINTEQGVEDNNKIYLPLYNDAQIKTLQVRVIKPNGKVIELDSKDIKEGTEDDIEVRYFALEGLEKGSQIEFFSSYLQSPVFTGRTVYMQSGIHHMHYRYELIYPSFLTIAHKSYAGAPSLVENEERSTDENKSLTVSIDNLPALRSEPRSEYKPHLQRFIYKVNDNLRTGANDLFTYDNIGSDRFDFTHTPDKKVDKWINKLVQNSGASKESGTEARIRTLENYIKTKFYTRKIPSVDFTKFKEGGFVSKADMLNIFSRALQQLDVEHALVITNDRTEQYFDQDFECYNFLQDVLLYFPSEKRYLSPSASFLRYPYVAMTNTHNGGIFVEEFSMAEISTGTTRSGFIEALPAKFSADTLLVDVTWDADELKEVHFIQTKRGYSSSSFQAIFDLLDEESTQETKDELLEFMGDDVEIIEGEVRNIGANLYGVKPLELEATIKGEPFYSFAGDKILLNVGELIGPQSEMYQEGDRTLPADNYFAHNYYRELRIAKPEGYSLENEDAAVFDVWHYSGELAPSGFKSSVRTEGNEIVITIDEWYESIIVPVEEFEEYRAVINAAADFNKVVLVFVPNS